MHFTLDILVQNQYAADMSCISNTFRSVDGAKRGKSGLEDLSTELLQEIFKLLDFSSLATAVLVCRRVHPVAEYQLYLEDARNEMPKAYLWAWAYEQKDTLIKAFHVGTGIKLDKEEVEVSRTSVTLLITRDAVAHLPQSRSLMWLEVQRTINHIWTTIPNNTVSIHISFDAAAITEVARTDSDLVKAVCDADWGKFDQILRCLELDFKRYTCEVYWDALNMLLEREPRPLEFTRPSRAIRLAWAPKDLEREAIKVLRSWKPENNLSRTPLRYRTEPTASVGTSLHPPSTKPSAAGEWAALAERTRRHLEQASLWSVLRMQQLIITKRWQRVSYLKIATEISRRFCPISQTGVANQLIDMRRPTRNKYPLLAQLQPSKARDGSGKVVWSLSAQSARYRTRIKDATAGPRASVNGARVGT